MPEKDEIIKRLLTKSAEVITADELQERLASGNQLTHYIGFEISGYVHIGQGIMSALIMKDLADLGVKCTIWLADWHTWINDKLDGTKETAASIGRGYFTEAIKACFMAVGGNPDDLEFRLASDWYAKDAMRYFDILKHVEKHTTLARMQRSISIAGRQEGEDVDFAKLTYPAMQVADIFYQEVDIAHAGMDQRKAHVVMRDVAEKVMPGKPKPIAIHHPLLLGLAGGAEEEGKMSKSKPDTAIFIHDSEEEITRKIAKAFCAEKEVAGNPVLEWAKHLLFWNRTEPFRIEREEKHGGTVEFQTFEKLVEAYAAGEVHPLDLKAAVARELISLLAPVREYFAQPEIATKKEVLDTVLANR